MEPILKWNRPENLSDQEQVRFLHVGDTHDSFMEWDERPTLEFPEASNPQPQDLVSEAHLLTSVNMELHTQSLLLTGNHANPQAKPRDTRNLPQKSQGQLIPIETTSYMTQIFPIQPTSYNWSDLPSARGSCLMSLETSNGEEDMSRAPEEVLRPELLVRHMNSQLATNVQPSQREIHCKPPLEHVLEEQLRPATPVGTYNPRLQAAEEHRHRKEGRVHLNTLDS